MFESKPNPKPVAQQSDFGEAKMYVWVKALEMKVNNLLREVNIIKNDFMKKNVSLRKEMKSLNEDMLEVKRNSESTVQKIDLIIKELKKTAGVEEVEVLKKYVDFWNPINFVTQRDVERVVETKLGEAGVKIKHVEVENNIKN